GTHPVREWNHVGPEALRVELRKGGRTDQRFVRRRQGHLVAVVLQITRQRRDECAQCLRVGGQQQDAAGGGRWRRAQLGTRQVCRPRNSKLKSTTWAPCRSMAAAT